MAKGRYAEWLTPDGLLLLEGWARDGLTDEQIAKNAGIKTATLYNWRGRFPQLDAAIKKGKAPVDLEVENALLKRALGYDWEEKTTEVDSAGKKHVRVVTRHVPPDVGAICFWLKNRKPRNWRERPIDETANDVLQKAREILGAYDGAIK